jgi:putative membrane protein
MRTSKIVGILALSTMPAAAIAAPAMTSATYEKQSSTLLMQSTANPALKTFAKEMITDHTNSTAALKAAAMKAGLHPAQPKLTAKQSSDLAALRAATGTARDTLYIQQQKAAHQEALALHQDESSTGTAAPLKAAAAKIVPVVQHHVDMLAAK